MAGHNPIKGQLRACGSSLSKHRPTLTRPMYPRVPEEAKQRGLICHMTSGGQTVQHRIQVSVHDQVEKNVKSQASAGQETGSQGCPLAVT